MSVLAPNRVYQGFWIDHSKGNVLGSTITITSERAYAVVAVVSITIAFAGAHLWDIVAFFSYASHATHTARDGVHHQRQALLRNVSTPIGIVLKTLEAYWKWRHQKTQRHLFSKLIHLSLIATVCSVGFLVAGVLSSQVISTTAIQVLAQSTSPSCGFAVGGFENMAYQNAARQQSTQYATNCYNWSQSDPGCQVFVTQAIPFQTTYTACPFDNALCKLEKENEQAIEMDTGHMSSNKVFGINAKQADTVSLRKVTTCAPLEASQYCNVTQMTPEWGEYTGAPPLSGENVRQWQLGRVTNSIEPNVTWRYAEAMTIRTSSVLTRMASWTYLDSDTPQFFPNVQQTSGSDMHPIDPFQHTKPDFGSLTAVLVKTNQLGYGREVRDPVFSWRTPRNITTYMVYDDSYLNVTTWYQDDKAGVLACTDRVQFCIPDGRCTALTHPELAGIEAVRSFDLSERANVTLYTFMNAVNAYTGIMANVIDEFFNLPLLIFNEKSPEYQNYPMDNQWELEVKYWQSIVLSMIQKTMSDVSAGQGLSSQQFDNMTHWPPGPGEKFLCHAQKMMAPLGFSNISVFGLGFIISICGSIIFVNVSLATILHWSSWKYQKERTAMVQWHEDDVLTFQRLAYESNGIGTWQGRLNRVPTTVDDERFHRLADVVKLPDQSSKTHLYGGDGSMGGAEHSSATDSLPGSLTPRTEKNFASVNVGRVQPDITGLGSCVQHPHANNSKTTTSHADKSSSSNGLRFLSPFTSPFMTQIGDTLATDANTKEKFDFDEDQYQTKFSRRFS